MNKVIKTISLEVAKSRIPTTLTSIKDDKLINFNENTFVTYPNGSFGMIPCDIIVDGFAINTQTDLNVNIKTDNDEDRNVYGEYYPIEYFSTYKMRLYKQLGAKTYYYIHEDGTYENCDGEEIKRYSIFHKNLDIEPLYEESDKGLMDKEICEVEGEANGTKITVLSYRTLVTWFHFFNYYYSLLQREDCSSEQPYTSAVDYYENTVKQTTSGLRVHGKCPYYIDSQQYTYNDLEYYQCIDKTFEARGGEAFYNWMCENIFVKYDIPKEYVDGWHTSFLYYPSIVYWKGWFEERYKRYSSFGSEERCNESSDCCDCQEYFKRGGNSFYNWLQNCKLKDSVDTTETSTITIPICISTTIDNMGEMSILSEDWVEGETYSENSTVVYDNEVWIKNDSGEGFVYDDAYKEIIWGNSNGEKQWEKYNTRYYDKHCSETKNDEDKTISGITDSKLIDLKDVNSAKDDMGNDLPGSFVTQDNQSEPSDDITFAQPSEGHTLDLLYHVGNVNNIESYDTEDEDSKIVYGDIITKIEVFYYKYNEDGDKVISDLNGELNNGEDKTPLKLIEEVVEKYNNLDDKTDIINELMCRVTYYNSAKLTVKAEGDDENGYTYDGYECDENTGIQYIDEFKLVRKPCNYYLSEDEIETIYYYDFEYEMRGFELSDYGNIGVQVRPTTFTVFEDEKEKSEKVMDVSPTTRVEYKFGISTPNKVNSQIYVDRGICTAFDKHLKLTEISSLEALEQYSNGALTIISNS